MFLKSRFKRRKLLAFESLYKNVSKRFAADNYQWWEICLCDPRRLYFAAPELCFVLGKMLIKGLGNFSQFVWRFVSHIRLWFVHYAAQFELMTERRISVKIFENWKEKASKIFKGELTINSVIRSGSVAVGAIVMNLIAAAISSSVYILMAFIDAESSTDGLLRAYVADDCKCF